jgi:hypothetical protein
MGIPGTVVWASARAILDGERRDSQFILGRALDRDRVITLRSVGVSLCVGLIVLSCLLLQGCS